MRKAKTGCRKNHVREPKPPIAPLELSLLCARFVRLSEELADVFGLELVENRVVRRAAALEDARHYVLK